VASAKATARKLFATAIEELIQPRANHHFTASNAKSTSVDRG